MHTVSKLDDFLAVLRRSVQGELRDDPYTRVLYSTDASLYQLMPLAVLVPLTIDDIQCALALAHEYQIPVLPRAAGTSLAGQAVNEALIIDLSRHIDGLLEVNPEERWARVQPGIVLDELNVTLRPHGLQFGPDPASSDRSSLGGAVANNATGSHSLLYGMSADHVLAMEVVLSDGSRTRFGHNYGGISPDFNTTAARIYQEIASLLAISDTQDIIRSGTPGYWRRAGGYLLDRLLDCPAPDLSRLICGSEGTLAIMTELTVNLVPIAPAAGLALLQFDDVMQALTLVADILQTGPSAVELLDALSLTLCLDVPEYARLLRSVIGDQHQPRCMLIIEYQGDTELEVRAGIARLRPCLSQVGRHVQLIEAIDPQHQAAIWRVRKVGLGLLMSARGNMKPIPFIEDAAVPVEHLPSYVREIETFCASLDTPVTYYAHAGAGCLHIRPLMDVADARQLARMPDIARFSAGLVKGYGGALSSEHGDGRARSWLNEAFYGPDLYGLYRRVKRIFDPRNILNPGIVVDAAPMTANMRRQAVKPDRPLTDFNDYVVGPSSLLTVAGRRESRETHQSGFIRAIEMCNGAGVCRQRMGGTMCPSFMVTRDEMHSTRGRANALRAVFTGALSPDEMTSRRMFDVMDLCISCKACKAECPSAVDMARLKLEFLARYHEKHGTTLRDHMMAHIADLSRLGSGSTAPVINALSAFSPARRLLERAVGVTARRPLPPMARQSFVSWWRKQETRVTRSVRTDARPMALLVDAFTNYNYPEIGVAAVEFLTAAGQQVLVPPVRDEGRPFISKGMIARAQTVAMRTVAVLAPLAEQGIPIVGLEPSSILTLRDEYSYLVGDDSRARSVAERSLTFEEYVDGLATAGELHVEFTDTSRSVLLHGHCHQKALVGTEPARRALSLPRGYRVEEVDSGCCGMAGSFGYESEHYSMAMQMAERRLLPAVRAADPDTIIVAAGVSCRQQIAHGTRRIALHPAQVLREALQEPPA